MKGSFRVAALFVTTILLAAGCSATPRRSRSSPRPSDASSAPSANHRSPRASAIVHALDPRLHNKGLTDAELTESAQVICESFQAGFDEIDVEGTLLRSGFDGHDMAALMNVATRTLCPQYASQS
jgi:hypothetical protein